jgi:hypothetical protein
MRRREFVTLLGSAAVACIPGVLIEMIAIFPDEKLQR